MAVMKKDVNIGLLFLIVATLLMFSGFTVYYQTTFKNISQNYKVRLDELNSITKELEAKRSLLNETSLQLKLKKQQEEGLNSKYSDVRSERDQLETDKKKLELNLAQTSADLAQTKNDLDKKTNQLANVQKQLEQERIDADAKIAGLNSLIDTNNLQIATLQKKISCLKSTQGASETC